MIGYVKGIVEGIYSDYVIVENQGIGYRIFTSGKALGQMNALHQEVKLYTYLHVREDELTLFGFPTVEEMDVFKLLLSVNGIGPKVALSVLSALSVKELSIAVMMGDVKAITRANGVGKKGAERMIMELKDKMNFEDALTLSDSGTSMSDGAVELAAGSNNIQDAVLALVSLGYSDYEAMNAIKQIPDAENMDSDKLLKAALKKIF